MIFLNIILPYIEYVYKICICISEQNKIVENVTSTYIDVCNYKNQPFRQLIPYIKMLTASPLDLKRQVISHDELKDVES